MSRSIKRGDTYPALTGSVSNDSGGVALTAADSVTVLLKPQSGTVVELTATSVDDPSAGDWSYTWQAGDTDTVGIYSVEVEVTWSTGVIQTFPNIVPSETVTIVQDLNPA